jgi:hypothetical protein
MKEREVETAMQPGLQTIEVEMAGMVFGCEAGLVH